MSAVPEKPRPAAVEEPLQDEDGADAPGRPTVDEMSEWSFPASDPPATWNWEPRRR
jgi:hypothetical protein